MLVDTESDITIKGKEFRVTAGLWELLTRKSVDRKKITPVDLKKYKKILEVTKAHLTDYQPGGDIQITRGSKYRDVIPPLFRTSGDEVSKQRYVAGGQSNNGRHR